MFYARLAFTIRDLMENGNSGGDAMLISKSTEFGTFVGEDGE